MTTNKTLVLYHNNHIENINNMETNDLPKLEKNLEKLEKKMKKTTITPKAKVKIIMDIKVIKNKIEKIKNKKINYYKKSFNNLKLYYDKDNKNNKDIFEDYLEKVDKNFVSDTKYSENIYICNKCNINKKLILENSICICENCGEFNKIILECDKSLNKDNDLNNNTMYSYKRIGHFLITLNNIKNQVDNNDFNKIKNHIKNNKKYKKITENNLKIVLKELKLYKKYSKNINIIYRKIKGFPVLIIDKNLEDKLIYMFKQIEDAFEKHIPSNRKNFFSYPYCIRKSLELLDIDYNLLDNLKSLKGTEKLYTQDKMWQKICEECRWEYIPSF
jgi:hypothetical protein